MKTAQRGNILFLILLAVILFAALSYAVTSSMKGGGSDASGEKLQAEMAEMYNHFALTDAAITRMMLSKNVKDYQLNFRNATSPQYISSSYTNPNCLEDRCRVFHADGGGVEGKTFKAMLRSGASSSSRRLFYISVPGAGTSAPDIAYAIYTIKTSMCIEANNKIGYNDMFYGVTVNETNSLMYYSSDVPLGPIPSSTQTLTGLPTWVGSHGTFCTCSGANLAACESGLNPVLWHVILPR